MLARFRTQLRLLLFTTVAVAALALPAGASAAAALQFNTDPDGPDDGQTFTWPNEEAHYDFFVQNTGPDATVNTRMEFEYATAELELDLLQTNVGGAFDCTTVDNAGTTVATCPIDDLGNGDAIIVMLDMSLADGFSGSTTTLTARAVADGTASADLVDTTMWDYAPTCENFGYFYDNRFTRAELQTNGTLTFSIDCTDPDGGALNLTDKVGTNGTLSGTAANVTFTATAAALASPNGFHEYFGDVELTDAQGDTITADIFLSAYTQSNTSSTVSGATAYAVPAAGGTVTYTNTVRNAGPDALGRVSFGWEISDKATVISATADGVAATCQPADYGDEGMRAFGCGSAAMPAVGASVVGTLTVRYAAGEKGLTLPSTVKVTALAGPDSTTGAEDRTYTDNESVINTALTAYVAPANPTQGTDGNDTYAGTTGNDTFAGGAGNDSFRGEGGDDKFYGGAGDDVFDGGAGNDSFYGGTGDDSGFGGLGNDLMFGGLGKDRLVGGDGTDKLYGQGGNDRLLGSTGNDIVNGGAGNDVVRGGTGIDVLFCGSGTDIAMGDNGNDLISCRDGKGGDILSGGNGRDTCIGDVGDRFWSCERIIRLA